MKKRRRREGDFGPEPLRRFATHVYLGSPSDRAALRFRTEPWLGPPPSKKQIRTHSFQISLPSGSDVYESDVPGFPRGRRNLASPRKNRGYGVMLRRQWRARATGQWEGFGPPVTSRPSRLRQVPARIDATGGTAGTTYWRVRSLTRLRRSGLRARSCPRSRSRSPDPRDGA